MGWGAGRRHKLRIAGDCDFPRRGCGMGAAFLAGPVLSSPHHRGRALTMRGSHRTPLPGEASSLPFQRIIPYYPGIFSLIEADRSFRAVMYSGFQRLVSSA